MSTAVTADAPYMTRHGWVMYAPLLFTTTIDLSLGWEGAFLITGALGFCWPPNSFAKNYGLNLKIFGPALIGSRYLIALAVIHVLVARLDA